MNEELTPIDTQYMGYLFRSRLEARWAAFFQALGWKWAYEFEGYKLESGYYLPDFYFPELNTWAEVKSDYLNQRDMIRCKELSKKMTKSTTGVDVILLEGYQVTATPFRTIVNGNLGPKVLLIAKSEGRYPFFSAEILNPDMHYFMQETFYALKKAREARFEFEWKEVASCQEG